MVQFFFKDEITRNSPKCTTSVSNDRKDFGLEIGYAFDNEEGIVGVRCVAVPVFNSRKEVIGAIGFSGMAQNMTTDKMQSHAEFIKNIAEKMSINIGNDILL